MDIGKITQLAKGEFGPHARCVYHQDLTGPSGQDHLKVDELGANDFDFKDSGVPDSHPGYVYEREGLLLSVQRPVPTGPAGSWAAITVTNAPLPPAVLLVAVLQRPVRVPLGEGYVEGAYAPSLLMNAVMETGSTALIGATSQVKPEGVRLNLPGTMLAINRPSIDAGLQAEMLSGNQPVTLGLKVDRTVSPVAGKAWLFVGKTLADSVTFAFTNVNASTPMLDVRAGMGTAAGVHYKASVYLLRFQVWAPRA